MTNPTMYYLCAIDVDGCVHMTRTLVRSTEEEVRFKKFRQRKDGPCHAWRKDPARAAEKIATIALSRIAEAEAALEKAKEEYHRACRWKSLSAKFRNIFEEEVTKRSDGVYEIDGLTHIARDILRGRFVEKKWEEEIDEEK